MNVCLFQHKNFPVTYFKLSCFLQRCEHLKKFMHYYIFLRIGFHEIVHRTVLIPRHTFDQWVALPLFFLETNKKYYFFCGRLNYLPRIVVLLQVIICFSQKHNMLCCSNKFCLRQVIFENNFNNFWVLLKHCVFHI